MEPINKQCSKCGYEDANIKLNKKGDRLVDSDRDFNAGEFYAGYVELRDEENSYTYPVYIFTRDCLKVHCRTCQNFWLSDTAEEIESPTNAFGMTEEDIEQAIKDFRGPSMFFNEVPYPHTPTGGPYYMPEGSICFSIK